MKSLIFATCLFVSTPLFAHEAPSGWTYPMECCHEMDCGPVTSFAYTNPKDPNKLPQMIVSNFRGTVIVPKDFPIRPSPDNLMHACIHKGDEIVPARLLCLFVPPTM